MTTTERLSVLQWLDIVPTHVDDFDCYIRRLDAWMVKRGLAAAGDVIAVVRTVDARYDPAVYINGHIRYLPVVTPRLMPAAWEKVREFVEVRMEQCPAGAES